MIAVGRFDGVHLGHRHLLSQARAVAQAHGCPLLAYTFPPDPPALLPLSAKVRLLRELADEVEVAPFAQVRELRAEEFLRQEIQERLGGCALVMGPDHRFGRAREADPEQAKKLGEKLGLEVWVVEPFQLDGQVVS
ncbi:MAG: riboflavin biosynthesis protein RibF, partial [Candidatus Bipolaricaulaceae bacterium]